MPSEEPGVFWLSLGTPRLCVSTQPCMPIQLGTFVPGVPVDMGTCALGPGYPYMCTHVLHSYYVPSLCMLSTLTPGSLHVETGILMLSSDDQMSKGVNTLHV